MTDFKALREQKELIKMREASMYSWRDELSEEKKDFPKEKVEKNIEKAKGQRNGGDIRAHEMKAVSNYVTKNGQVASSESSRARKSIEHGNKSREEYDKMKEDDLIGNGDDANKHGLKHHSYKKRQRGLAAVGRASKNIKEEKDSKPCEKCGKDPCECEDKKGKKAGKHPFVEVMPTSKDGLKENTRLSLKPNTQFHLDEIYKGKHGQSEKEYQDSRSDAGKMISGDSKGSGANYSYRAKNTGTNPAGGKEKPQGQARMASKDREYLKYRKSSMKKEELSIDDQMRISREAAKGRNPNPDHRAIRAKQLKNIKSPKDTRTDAQKMADATGPRKGSNYRGD